MKGMHCFRRLMSIRSVASSRVSVPMMIRNRSCSIRHVRPTGFQRQDTKTLGASHGRPQTDKGSDEGCFTFQSGDFKTPTAVPIVARNFSKTKGSKKRSRVRRFVLMSSRRLQESQMSGLIGFWPARSLRCPNRLQHKRQRFHGINIRFGDGFKKTPASVPLILRPAETAARQLIPAAEAQSVSPTDKLQLAMFHNPLRHLCLQRGSKLRFFLKPSVQSSNHRRCLSFCDVVCRAS